MQRKLRPLEPVNTAEMRSARDYATFLQAEGAARVSQVGCDCAPKRDAAILFCPERRQRRAAHPLEGIPFFQEATVFENSTACAPRPVQGRVCVQVRPVVGRLRKGLAGRRLLRLTRLVPRSSPVYLELPMAAKCGRAWRRGPLPPAKRPRIRLSGTAACPQRHLRASDIPDSSL